MADIPVAAPATRKQQWLQHMPETQRFMELCSQNNWKSLPGGRSQEERESGLKAFLEDWKKVYKYDLSRAQLAGKFKLWKDDLLRQQHVPQIELGSVDSTSSILEKVKEHEGAYTQSMVGPKGEPTAIIKANVVDSSTPPGKAGLFMTISFVTAATATGSRFSTWYTKFKTQEKETRRTFEKTGTKPAAHFVANLTDAT
jgi:hypothetical protein